MLRFTFTSPKSDDMRLTAAHIIRRVYGLAALILFIAAANFACRRAEPSGQADNTQSAGEVMVSAAASLKDAFGEISKQHEARTGVKINFNYGASGALQKQIESGAPVDVFASAGRPQMDALVKRGLVVAETQRDFARNSLVLIIPSDSKSGITAVGDLGGPKVTRLAVGNPKTVPAGQYTEQSLTRLGLWQGLGERLILAEDVRQVLDYVARGEVDAGIVYASDTLAAGNKIVKAATIRSDTHDPILYPIAVIRASSREATARRFIETVMSDEGQRIMEKYGFERARVTP